MDALHGLRTLLRCIRLESCHMKQDSQNLKSDGFKDRFGEPLYGNNQAGPVCSIFKFVRIAYIVEHGRNQLPIADASDTVYKHKNQKMRNAGNPYKSVDGHAGDRHSYAANTKGSLIQHPVDSDERRNEQYRNDLHDEHDETDFFGCQFHVIREKVHSICHHNGVGNQIKHTGEHNEPGRLEA